ncbi:hypothetical protein [Vibrio tarriae]|nr:hypothetical protein [Vibrio tarriae]
MAIALLLEASTVLAATPIRLVIKSEGKLIIAIANMKITNKQVE